MDLNKVKWSDYVDVWKVKSMVNQVKNAVYNYTEYEVKVRDATNNEPWGASSTLMQDIAAATHHYVHFPEVMDTIYRRFIEKGGAQWRQVYKALQLLEYLMKNGSERVIDSAREHSYELRALRNFHYVDDKGKDQGINGAYLCRRRVFFSVSFAVTVRNRAKEIMELLDNPDKLRAERVKAKENRAKYTGIASTGGSSRYGGFGQDSVGYGGNAGSGWRDESAGYDDYSTPARSDSYTVSSPKAAEPKPVPASEPTHAPPAPAVDLLDMGADDNWGGFSGTTKSSSSQEKASSQKPMDDFADFQSAPSVNAPASAGVPSSFNATFPATSSNTGFASFSAQPASTTNLFAFNGGSAMNSAAQTGFSQGGFGSTGQQKTTDRASTGTDAFSKLVSLDANSLTGAGKKEGTTGPSLNALGQSSANFAQFGVAPGVRPAVQAAGFGAQFPSQSQNQPNQGGFGGSLI
ncbi:Epsin-3, clathrin recruitment and traffic between the Golgi and endosome [Gaertneriomyces sp. JEL0708]|nr:Epsin-3, clathrin recruitment and traffic between the Golgi and endosome [Gaertneriomyces sp. JEL0708]